MKFDPLSTSIGEIAFKVSSASLTVQQVVESYVERVKAFEPKINAFVDWDESELANQLKPQIARLEEKLDQGQDLPLAGVPIAIKDNICTEGIQTTAGSAVLKGFKPVYNATVVDRLSSAGALVFGKTNLDEFAMGSSSEHSAFGAVKNPWNVDYVPGGSSGGSAAAVAAALVPGSLGSDTGGSVRQPASFCGVVGFKPSYGCLSRYGLIAYGSSLDQVGPLARSAYDCALMMSAMAGHDPMDSTSLTNVSIDMSDFQNLGGKDLRGVKVGIIKEFDRGGLQKEVDESFAVFQDRLRSLGAEMVEVSLPSIEYAIPTYYILATAEASSNLARYDGVRYGHREVGDDQTLEAMYQESRTFGFGQETQKRIMLGTYVLSAGYYDAYYHKAQHARQKLKNEFSKVFEAVDLIASPTAPTSAFKIGHKINDSVAMYLGDIFTIAQNLVGCPAISLPLGQCEQGLPIGMQLSGRPLMDDALLKGAAIYEHKFRKDPIFPTIE